MERAGPAWRVGARVVLGMMGWLGVPKARLKWSIMVETKGRHISGSKVPFAAVGFDGAQTVAETLTGTW